MNLPEQNSNTQQTPSKTPGAVAGEGGFLFEMNIAAIIGLRGMQTDDNFELSSNVEDGGNFDDLVYKAGDRRYYLQLKHSDISDKKRQRKELKELLQKCFESYCKIKSGEALKGITTDKMKFIIYTNIELDRKLPWCKEKHTGDDIFFKTCDSGIFTFIRDNTGKKNDVHTLLENPVKKGKNDKESKDPGLIPPVDMINEFLSKLIMVTGQKGNQELDDFIAEEIKNKDTIKLDDTQEYKSILYHFKPPLATWWRSRERFVLTLDDLRNWLQRAKTEHFAPFVKGLNSICTTKLVGTGIEFSGNEISRHQTELSNKCAVHLRSDALTLCSILLLECLGTSKCVFVTFESLQMNKDRLLYVWLGGYWEWLIVFCDSTVQQSDISETCLEISEIMKRDHSTKYVIILTTCSVEQIRGFSHMEYEFNFEQLSKESQKIVLDKKIDFQDCKVTMRSVLQLHGNVQHVLGPELVIDLITQKTPINIGGSLQLNTDHYKSRVFKRKIWLSLDILKARGTYPDVFAVNGIKKNNLIDIVPSGEEVGSFYFEEGYVIENSTNNYDVLGNRFIVLKGRNAKSCFLKLCEIRSTETLHWLKYKDGKLLWKETYGKSHNLLKADQRIVRSCMKSGSCEVNEDSIWDLGERTVLVVAEPGMGKSSTTTQMARNTKSANPTSWVLRINWNDHTRKLQEINAETFNFDLLFEFLCSAAVPESKYTDISRNLLKQALQNSGNVTVLMDGFDEISPFHADKAAAILSELMKTKVERVWVTSRPVQKERLEKDLSVVAFSMKKLSHGSQIKLFMDICKRKANGNKEECLHDYVQGLLRHANNSRHHRNFTGSPLNIMMIASTFEENLETSLRTGKISLPDKLDFLELYNKFIEKKQHIYETEKKRVDLTNASVRDEQEIWMEIYPENLEKCSLLVTLPSELNTLLDKETQATIQNFLKRLQAGKDKIGIVMDVVENRPHFVHRKFAEYFTACWFSKNFVSNRRVLERILFDCSYGFVKDVFDRILAKDCPLHCAVLDWNTEAVESLLKGGSDVNAVDSGGRTALHVIAAQGPGDPVCEEITNSLLGCGAIVDTKDKVLQWIPLRYARKTKNQFVEDLL